MRPIIINYKKRCIKKIKADLIIESFRELYSVSHFFELLSFLRSNYIVTGDLILFEVMNNSHSC